MFLGIGGLAVVIWLVHDVGVDELSEVLVPALPWLPLAAALELGRIGMDTLSSRLTLGRHGHRVPFWPLLGSHLVAYAVMGVAPAGRSTAEAVKASLLARWIGAPTAVALGTANQANTFLSSGTFTFISTGAAYALTGPSDLTKAFLAHSVLLNLFGLGMRLIARYRGLGRALGRRFPRFAPGLTTFVDASRETSLIPIGPVLAMMAGRALQASHYLVLLAAVGATATVITALAVHGLYLVIAALGVLIPGQLGASEGGFAAAHELLGMTEARALAVALLAHAVQLALVALGFIVLAAWPSSARADTPTGDPPER